MPSSSMGVMSWSKRLGQSPWKAALISKLHSWNLRMPHFVFPASTASLQPSQQGKELAGGKQESLVL